MKSLTDKKIILRRFSRTGLLCLHEKFQVCQSSPSGFVKKCQIFDHICMKNFSIKIFTVLHQSKKELLDLDQNWAKTRHLLFKTWISSISMDSPIVHWTEMGQNNDFLKKNALKTAFWVDTILDRLTSGWDRRPIFFKNVIFSMFTLKFCP